MSHLGTAAVLIVTMNDNTHIVSKHRAQGM